MDVLGEKNKHNGIHDTEQCFLNPVYGEMKGILRFVNRHEADDQRDDAEMKNA